MPSSGGSAVGEVTSTDRARGCLLGGAVGDALGGPVEFMSLAAIRRRHGDTIDLLDLAPARFTDDTQMTLFTAEGLIRWLRAATENTATHREVVYRAYLRWLHTQGTPWSAAAGHLADAGGAPDGWLVTNRVLHRRAAPGNTCLSALHSGRMGTPTERINDSKGCGGVMRAAPVGLCIDDPAEAFRIGCDIAAITHGHPAGFLSAGALAAMVAHLMSGAEMSDAVTAALRLVEQDPDGTETATALRAGIALGEQGVPAPEQLERIGGGWVGEEALAIAVACALPATGLAGALSVAVFHSGDSDSTGAICGNLLGVLSGLAAIPAGWLDVLEGREVVDQVARDLWAVRDQAGVSDLAARYPA
jgi:ADP-ribosylglycohydrolase